MRKEINFNCLTAGATPDVGSRIVLRDFTPFLPTETPAGRFPWGTRGYRLLDGTRGNALWVHSRTGYEKVPADDLDFSTAQMPPVIEIPLPLEGTYAITAGIPFGGAGVDLALDGEGFTAVAPNFGARRGRTLAEGGREYRVFWKRARLHHATLSIRVPYGTFNACAVVTLCAALSSLTFERLPDDAPLAPVAGKPDKKFVMCIDGFSHYALWGVPGENFEERLCRAYDGSDVKIFMLQVAGGLLWKSEVNSYLGEGMTPEDYVGKRTCDVRVTKYLRHEIERGADPLKIQTEACHKHGIESHFSIRANLYFAGDTKYSKGTDSGNGRFWHEHPEYRLPNDARLDYGKREVREYYLSVFRDALERYDLDGINLDLTRWPNCLDKRYHAPSLLVDLCGELRALADRFGKERGKHIKVSLSMVEQYHAWCSLEDQAIDFGALAASGTLDFICLEAQTLDRYAEIAHAHRVELYGIIDGNLPYYPHTQDDPLWNLPDGTEVDDPCAGEEFAENPGLPGSVPAPFENLNTMSGFYEQGADGIVKVNDFMGTLYFRDCGHSDAVREHAEKSDVFGQSAGEYLFFD